MVPGDWAKRDIWKARGRDISPAGSSDVYDIDYPRLWAFEISTVHDNVDILLFSKLMLKVWPDAGAVARRLNNFVEDSKTMNGN